ncbi:MAG: hypothetical protein ACTSPK_13290, partial [Candidatus Heimdallarchaeota archaeon]
MRLIKNKSLKLIILFIFVSFIPVQVAQSSTNVGILNSTKATEPTIDGKITDAEWNTTQEL